MNLVTKELIVRNQQQVWGCHYSKFNLLSAVTAYIKIHEHRCFAELKIPGRCHILLQSVNPIRNTWIPVEAPPIYRRTDSQYFLLIQIKICLIVLIRVVGATGILAIADVMTIKVCYWRACWRYFSYRFYLGSNSSKCLSKQLIRPGWISIWTRDCPG